MIELILALAGVIAVIYGIYLIATGQLIVGIILVVVGLVVAGAFGRGYFGGHRRTRL